MVTLKAIALGVLKLSMDDFYELTPVEMRLIQEKHQQDRQDFFELQHRAVYVGFGQANSGKKFKSMFKKQKADVPSRSVSADQKQLELKEIQDRLMKGVV